VQEASSAYQLAHDEVKGRYSEEYNVLKLALEQKVAGLEGQIETQHQVGCGPGAGLGGWASTQGARPEGPCSNRGWDTVGLDALMSCAGNMQSSRCREVGRSLRPLPVIFKFGIIHGKRAPCLRAALEYLFVFWC
jgi:hypothetical protein